MWPQAREHTSTTFVCVATVVAFCLTWTQERGRERSCVCVGKRAKGPDGACKRNLSLEIFQKESCSRGIPSEWPVTDRERTLAKLLRERGGQPGAETGPIPPPSQPELSGASEEHTNSVERQAR